MLRIEGFDGVVRGRCLVLGKEANWLSQFNALEAESLYKGRSVLVLHEPRGTVSSGLLRKRWDCVFRVKESFEAQMLATYVANAPKPVRILWVCAPSHDIPRALWQRWTNDVTLIGGASSELHGCDWDTILFPLQNTAQFTEKILAMRGSYRLGNVGQHLAEIAANGAALAWNESGFYWYEPSEDHEKLTKGEAVKLLEDVISYLK